MAERRLLAILVGMVTLAALTFVAVGLILADSLPGRLLTGAGFRPRPRHPTAGRAVVDGQSGEWVLDEDLFAAAQSGGQEEQEVRGRLYLRYDCQTNLMYALFLSAGEWPILRRRSQVRLALDSSSEEVPLVGFAWIEPGYDGNSQHTRGWEASFATTPGEHWLWAAAPAVAEGQVQEMRTVEEGIAMALECDDPASLFLSRLEAVSIGGQVRLEWETAWEVDCLGFNVYHSLNSEGPWSKLNRNLIRRQTAPEASDGAKYQFMHAGADVQAENYYLLEDVTSEGIATRHGPVSP